jgi:hypothetical protein
VLGLGRLHIPPPSERQRIVFPHQLSYPLVVHPHSPPSQYSIEPEAMHKRALQFKADGFRYEKWFMAFGPGAGPEGLRKNVEMVRIFARRSRRRR